MDEAESNEAGPSWHILLAVHGVYLK